MWYLFQPVQDPAETGPTSWALSCHHMNKQWCLASSCHAPGILVLLLSPVCLSAKPARAMVLELQQHCSFFLRLQPSAWARATVLEPQQHWGKVPDTRGTWLPWGEQAAVLGCLQWRCWGSNIIGLTQVLGCHHGKVPH